MTNRFAIQDEIASVKVTFADNGEIRFLVNRKHSRCHFFERFCVGDDEIQLRLDWGDEVSSGFPTLDADFYDFKTNKKKRLKGQRLKSHNTEPEVGARKYNWSFKDFNRTFSVQVVWSGRAIFSGSSDLIVDPIA
jgi:hypothetical protein